MISPSEKSLAESSNFFLQPITDSKPRDADTAAKIHSISQALDDVPNIVGHQRYAKEGLRQLTSRSPRFGASEVPRADWTPAELDELASALVSLLTWQQRRLAGPHGRAHFLLLGDPGLRWRSGRIPGDQENLSPRLQPRCPHGQEDLHRVVRWAKKQYWRNLVDNFSSSGTVYKAVRWLRSPGPFQPPPLQVDDIVYETQMDKTNALGRATLEAPNFRRRY
ncbi:lipase class 3 [Fusarium beomiforme]|uniref:Lipase class 3 n=1 Tax=Fusarium beomiforme TaxID=44412 RepID=A0A9P5AHF6_9HYPO|nr:lipase class 3 [Fusarium beomiforme]